MNGQRKLRHTPPSGAFALFEVLLVLFAIVLVGVIALATIAGYKAKASRVDCLANLNQIGLLLREYGSDHEEKAPWQVSESKGGSLEYVNTTEAFRHYKSLEYLIGGIPKFLTCPEDKTRRKAKDWSRLRNQNLSYFLNLDMKAFDGGRDELLAGDRTITTNHQITAGFLNLTSGDAVRWAQGLHMNFGNLVFADGSAVHMQNSNWASYITDFSLRKNTNWAVRLVLP